jgi:hypothetical protein
MHPVKAEEAIAEAYWQHGVRTFSLDTMEELEKIVRATRNAADLNLLVRLRVSSDHSKLSLAAKFGAEPDEVAELLMATRQAADALGIWSPSTSSMSAAASRRAIPAWSRPRSMPISTRSTAASKACRSAIRPNCGASPVARCPPNTAR